MIILIRTKPKTSNYFRDGCWVKLNPRPSNPVIQVLGCLAFQNMLKAVSATQKQVDLVKLHEQAKRNLEEEIQNYKDEAQKQRKIIFQLEKERDRYINEASDLTQKVSHSTERVGMVCSDACLRFACGCRTCP